MVPEGAGAKAANARDERPGVAEQERVEHQRRQAELVHHVGLVARSEIAHVLGVRHVGFRQQPHLGRDVASSSRKNFTTAWVCGR